jgi:hypothetical protein
MYIRYDENNQPVSPQPGFTTVTQFGQNEGWNTVTYQDFNKDYVRHDENNNLIGIGTYQRHNENNTPISVDAYQRHDDNNNPIYQ